MPKLKDCMRLRPARGVKVNVETLDRLVWFGVAAGLLKPLSECAEFLEMGARKRLKPMKVTVIHGQG